MFYRSLENADGGGTGAVKLIANNTTTYIPGTTTLLGSTSPPSAVNGMVVFAGFDNEEAPTLGGIYLAPIAQTPPLTTLVSIGGRVPGEGVNTRFTGLGEGAAFDGRYVAFWGSWGSATRTLRLYCPTEGNRDRIDYCTQELVCADTGETLGDPSSTCDATGCWQDKTVPVNQGVFVHDTLGGGTRTIAKTPARFDDFVFWSYSGKTPGVGRGHSEEGSEDDGEMTRWRSSAFVAVSGLASAFKARTGSIVGVYYNGQPGQDIFTVADTRTFGQSLPFNKEAFHMAGYKAMDDMSYFEESFGKGTAYQVGEVAGIWTTPGTFHVAFRAIPDLITNEAVLAKIRSLDKVLNAAKVSPARIGVVALNVHGGEGGMFGREEIDVIASAIQQAKAEGFNVAGPLPPDSAFPLALRGDYQGLVLMYHDQANIGRKIIGRDQPGVSLFLGMPVPVVTTPHGTAYDIAGKGISKHNMRARAITMTAALAGKGL